MNNAWIFYAFLIFLVCKFRNLYCVVIAKSPPPDRYKFRSFKILFIHYVITISFPKTHPANIETHCFQVQSLFSMKYSICYIHNICFFSCYTILFKFCLVNASVYVHIHLATLGFRNILLSANSEIGRSKHWAACN